MVDLLAAGVPHTSHTPCLLLPAQLPPTSFSATRRSGPPVIQCVHLLIALLLCQHPVPQVIVSELWVYPIKSCGGFKVPGSTLDTMGLANVCCLLGFLLHFQSNTTIRTAATC